MLDESRLISEVSWFSKQSKGLWHKPTEINILMSLSRSKCSCETDSYERRMTSTAPASWELQGCAASLGWTHLGWAPASSGMDAQVFYSPLNGASARRDRKGC